MTLNILSYVYWPLVCPLWRNAHCFKSHFFLFGIYTMCLFILSLLFYCIFSQDCLFFFGVKLYEFFIYNILDINLLLDVSLANMFSHSVDCLFILFLFPFLCKKILAGFSPTCLFIFLFSFPRRYFMYIKNIFIYRYINTYL